MASVLSSFWYERLQSYLFAQIWPGYLCDCIPAILLRHIVALTMLVSYSIITILSDLATGLQTRNASKRRIRIIGWGLGPACRAVQVSIWRSPIMWSTFVRRRTFDALGSNQTSTTESLNKVHLKNALLDPAWPRNGGP